jgi:ribokinase
MRKTARMEETTPIGDLTARTTEVLVVGSLILDIMVAAPHLPGMAETAIGTDWGQKCGGRGGRQAAAVAAAGGAVAIAGCVGADDFGRRLMTDLSEFGVDHRHVLMDAARRTGISVAIVDFAGDFGAVIVSGANLGIDPAAAVAAIHELRPGVLLLQNEIPESVNLAAAQAARAAGAIVIYNAAPMRIVGDALFAACDVLILDCQEASVLTGLTIRDAMTAQRAAPALCEKVATVLITLEQDGLVLAEAGRPALHIAPGLLSVVPVRAAMDQFVGMAALALARHQSINQAIGWNDGMVRPLISDQSFPF